MSYVTAILQARNPRILFTHYITHLFITVVYNKSRNTILKYNSENNCMESRSTYVCQCKSNDFARVVDGVLFESYVRNIAH